jgi:hypothetical protein
MSYTKDELKKIISDSINDLKENDLFILKKENDVSEVSISTKLASYITLNIGFDYSVDTEWNRMLDKHGSYVSKTLGSLNDRKVKPDIIIHKRGHNDDNILVIEIKMAWKNNRKDFDLQKLKAYINELDYQHGLYLELGENGITEAIWLPEL